jgi:hypothetical protein
MIIQMIISELKKKNYFRYLQLLFLESKKTKRDIALIFLFEYEVVKIFYSTKEPLLRKVKYQWLIDELGKKSSNFYLAQSLINSYKNLSIKKEIFEILYDFQKIEDNMEYPIRNILFFKKINIIYNKIFLKIELRHKDTFSISFLSQLMYFYYFKSEPKVFFYDEFNEIYMMLEVNKIDCFEKTFIEICIKKAKNLEFLKISKLEYILKLIFCMVFKSE